MDLGIAGKRAIVCGSTRGLGRACAEALLAEGVHVIINGRDAERTATAADALARLWPGVVTGVSRTSARPLVALPCWRPARSPIFS